MQDQSTIPILTEAQEIMNEQNTSKILDSDRVLKCDICKQKSLDEKQKKQNYDQEYQDQIKKNLITAYQISLQIDQMKNCNQNVFDNLRDQIIERIEIMKNNEAKLKESLRFKDKDSSYLRDKSQSFKKFKTKLKFQLSHNIIQKKIDSLNSSLENENHYQPIIMRSYKLDNRWEYYSFNYNDTIFVVGFLKVLKMFLFTRGELIQTDEVIGLQNGVTCLKFIPTQENYFVSGHNNNEIIIWKSSSKYKFTQIKVYKNIFSVRCMDCTSNVLAFGGYIGGLSIWNFELSDLVLKYSNRSSQDCISSISLNSQGIILICCFKKEYFMVYQLKDNNWEKVQKIIGYENVYSITQSNDFFVFFTSKNHSIVLFQQMNGNYVTVQTINLKRMKRSDTGFGFEICQYKNGFICKHDQDLYFFSYIKHQQFQLEFKMQFYSSSFNGCLTNNQEFMIIQEFNNLRVYKFVEKY